MEVRTGEIELFYQKIAENGAVTKCGRAVLLAAFSLGSVCTEQGTPNGGDGALSGGIISGGHELGAVQAGGASAAA